MKEHSAVLRAIDKRGVRIWPDYSSVFVKKYTLCLSTHTAGTLNVGVAQGTKTFPFVVTIERPRQEQPMSTG